MARKKFKLSKSLLARLVAIGVLSGLGGFAIYQSQFGEPAEDEAVDVAESDSGESDSDTESSGVDPSVKIPESVAAADDASKSAIEKAFSSNSSSSSSLRSSNSAPIRVASLDADSSPANGLSSRSTSSNAPAMPSPNGSLSFPGGQRNGSANISLSDSSQSSGGGSSSLQMPSSQPPALMTQSPSGNSPPPTQPPSSSRASLGDSSPNQPLTLPGSSPARLSDTTNGTGNPASVSSNPVGIPRPDGSTNGLRGAGSPPTLSSDELADAGQDASTNGGGSAPGRLAVAATDSSPMSSGDSQPGGTSSVPAMPDAGFRIGDRNASSTGERPSTLNSAPERLSDSTSSLASQTPRQTGNNSLSTDNLRSTPEASPSQSTEIGYGDSSPARLSETPSRSPELPGYGSSRSSSQQDDVDSSRVGIPSNNLSHRDNLAGAPSPSPVRSYGTTQDGAPAYGGAAGVGGQERGSYGVRSSIGNDNGANSPGTAGVATGSHSASLPSQTDAVSDTPGGKDIEGAQAPSLALEKRAPREVQVGRVANFETVIRNVGRTEATDVIVTDRIPAGTRLENVTPKPISQQGGLLIWNLGTIKPGQEQIITMNLVPERKGEIGSVAQVTFNAQAGVRTISTQPRLELQVEGPERVLIGQNATLRITIKNSGDGAATNVIIEEDVPTGVSHPEGRELQYPVGTLAPGEVRQLALTLRAESAAAVLNRIIARGDNGLIDEKVAEFEVVAPALKISMNGPNKRYLERTAIHRIKIENSGTAAATNVEIVAHLPKGLKFQETNNHGTYDPAAHAVYWGLESLPPGTSDDSIQLITLPVETGEQNIEYRVAADLNLSDANRMPVLVEELAELFFDIDDVADPIEVNSQTLYHLRVTNQGSKAATRVRIQVSFPPELEPINADGPVDSQMQGQAIVFTPIERIAPGEELLFKIQAKARREGDHRVSVQLMSDETAEPVIKQASTNVYRDR